MSFGNFYDQIQNTANTKTKITTKKNGPGIIYYRDIAKIQNTENIKTS